MTTGSRSCRDSSASPDQNHLAFAGLHPLRQHSISPVCTLGLPPLSTDEWVWLLPSDHPLHRVVQHINLDNAAPSLPSHYRTFNTTTGNSAPIQHIGIHPHSQTTACLFPLHCWTGSHVPYQRLFIAHAAYTPTAAWTISRLPPDSSRGIRTTPVLTALSF